jgi:SOS-response transcriptional repressor LexA
MKPIYADTLTTITRYLDANGYAPTVTEIAVALGISHNAARKRVLWLTECGLLTYTPRRLRRIALTGATVYRECKCGRPITDANVVWGSNHGKRWARRCKACHARLCRPHVQKWKQDKADYVRLQARQYNQRVKRQLLQERLAA